VADEAKPRYSYVYALSSRKYEQSRGFEAPDFGARSPPGGRVKLVWRGCGERALEAHVQVRCG